MVVSFVYFPSGPTKPSSLLGVSIALPILCIITIALRFNIRRAQKTPFMLDDWILLPALVFVIGMGIAIILGVAHKVWGQLSSAEPSDSSQRFESKLLEAFTYVQIFALSSIKFSALLFYHRLFQNKSRRSVFDITRTFLMVIVGLWTIAMILMNSLQCGTHISALWGTLDNYLIYCLKDNISINYLVGAALSNTLLDVMILLLPLPKIFGLHATRARKFAISGVFLLAAVGLAASIARSVASFQIKIGSFSTTEPPDFRLVDSLQVFWAMVESGLSLLAVNLPSIWAYTSHMSPDSIIASIRSAISLRSFGSNHNRESNSPGIQPSPGDEQSLHSSSSKAPFVAQALKQNDQGFSMYDVEAQKEVPQTREGVIVVN